VSGQGKMGKACIKEVEKLAERADGQNVPGEMAKK
jgi:hypothetical protein